MVPLVVPILFSVALAAVLFRSNARQEAPRGRPPLPTPVVLDRLVPPPQAASSASAAAGPPRADGLKAW